MGDSVTASATKDPELERALRAAADLPPGSYRMVADSFLAMSAPINDSAVAATVAWLVPLYRHADEVTLMRALSWLPTVLVVLLLLIGFVMSRSRASHL